MMRRERVFCDDCPSRDRICDTDENKCDMARWVQEAVENAPPLTDDQIATITRLLRGY